MLRHVTEVEPQGKQETPVIVAVNPWSGEDQIMIRCTYPNSITGEYLKENGEYLLTRKQGINLPLEQTLDIVVALLFAWNQEKGTSFALVQLEDEDSPHDEGPDEPWTE